MRIIRSIEVGDGIRKMGNTALKKSPAVVVFAVLIGLLSAGAAATELQDVLARHLRAIGERDSLVAIKSAAAFSTINYVGMSGKAISYVKFPVQYYARVELSVLSQEKGFDGLTAWTRDHSGITRRDIAEELKPMINELYFESYSYLLPDRNPGKTVYQGDTLIGGNMYYRLALYATGGDSLFLFISAQSGLAEYRFEIITGLPVKTVYEDFRKVHGVMMPFSMRSETPGAPYEMSVWNDSVWINPDLPDSIFLMPGISPVDYRFPQGADSIVIPFELVGNSLRINVNINGKGPFSFLLDSGSGTTMISDRAADSLEIRVGGDIPVRGVGGFGTIGIAEIDSLAIGQLSWWLSRVSVFDFKNLETLSLSTLDGILGYDFFARFPMRVSFDDQTLTLFDSRKATPQKPGERITADIFYQIPITDVWLNGKPLRVGFDLGAQAGVVIRRQSRWYKEMADAIDTLAEKHSVGGVGGTKQAKSFRADSLRIGALTIADPSVMVFGDDSALPLPDYVEGLLGVDILNRFNLFIDYGEGKIYFDPREAPDK
jgi:hypothetical protein